MTDHSLDGNDRRPLVYLPDGSPARVGLVANRCVGNVDRGMWGYDGPDGHQTVYFNESTKDSELVLADDLSFIQFIKRRISTFWSTVTDRSGGDA